MKNALNKLGYTEDKLIFDNQKSAVYLVHNAENQPAIAKFLTSDEALWVGKFAQEQRTYELLNKAHLALHVPQGIASAPHVLILEYIDGKPITMKRYITDELTTDEHALLAKLCQNLNQLKLPKNDFLQRYDYSRKIRHFIEYGLINEAEAKLLKDLQAKLEQHTFVPQHGDLIAKNILIDTAKTKATLIDWEFADLYLPYFDMAFLHTCTQNNKVFKQQLEDLLPDETARQMFYFNKAIITLREIRIHRRDEIFIESSAESLAYLYDEWAQLLKSLQT